MSDGGGGRPVPPLRFLRRRSAHRTDERVWLGTAGQNFDYRQPILAASRNAEEIRAMIGETLRHEIAHYSGIDDDRLEERGAY